MTIDPLIGRMLGCPGGGGGGGARSVWLCTSGCRFIFQKSGRVELRKRLRLLQDVRSFATDKEPTEICPKLGDSDTWNEGDERMYLLLWLWLLLWLLVRLSFVVVVVEVVVVDGVVAVAVVIAVVVAALH